MNSIKLIGNILVKSTFSDLNLPFFPCKCLMVDTATPVYTKQALQIHAGKYVFFSGTNSLVSISTCS